VIGVMDIAVQMPWQWTVLLAVTALACALWTALEDEA